MKNIWIVTGLMLLGFMCNGQKPSIVTGDEPGWYHIGKVSASFKSERESIVVMGKDQFESVKLRVNDAPINIERMQVYFEGGKVQDINVKQPLKAGEETREFDLEADNTEIDKVVFYYQTIGNENGDKASVELYGYKAERDGESIGVRDDEHNVENLEEAAERVESEVDEGAENFEENVDEHASKVGAEISDREVEHKAGPDGEEIYIDEYNKYYYIDENGAKIYVAPEDLTEREK